jgi:hypothetical protein
VEGHQRIELVLVDRHLYQPLNVRSILGVHVELQPQFRLSAVNALPLLHGAVIVLDACVTVANRPNIRGTQIRAQKQPFKVPNKLESGG